jgi:hypothetical protein
MSTEISCVLKDCIHNQNGICIEQKIKIVILGMSTLVCWNYNTDVKLKKHK